MNRRKFLKTLAATASAVSLAGSAQDFKIRNDDGDYLELTHDDQGLSFNVTTPGPLYDFRAKHQEILAKWWASRIDQEIARRLIG